MLYPSIYFKYFIASNAGCGTNLRLNVKFEGDVW